jgi:DNA-binding Lrp family transcriptional regulator
MSSVEESREETDKAAILAVLTEEGQAAADIAEAIKISPTTVRRRLEGLFESGLVSRAGDGVKGSAFMYSKIRFNHDNPLRVESNSNGHDAWLGDRKPMKTGETLLLEIRVLDDGFIQARRKDRRPLTDQDQQEAIKWVDSTPGVTMDQVLRVFPGARVRQ